MGLNVAGSDSLYWSTRIDNTDLKADAKETENIMGGLSQSVGKLFKFLILADLTMKASSAIKEVTQLAGRYETMGIVMETVGHNAGYTRKEMDGFQASLEKTGISMLAARSSLTKMLQAHLDLNKATELGRAAQDAAVIAHINSSEAFERMVTGIEQASPIMLRSMGINVTFQEGYDKLAKSLGKTVESLTVEEKAQSRLNTTLEATIAIRGTYEAAMTTADKQALSLERHIENLKILAGTVFLPVYTEIIEQITGGIVKFNTKLTGNEIAIQDWGVTIRTTLIDVEAEFVRLAMLMDKTMGTVTSVAGISAQMAALTLWGSNNPKEKVFQDFAKLMAEKNVAYDSRYNQLLGTPKSPQDEMSLYGLKNKRTQIKYDATPEVRKAREEERKAAETYTLAIPEKIKSGDELTEQEKKDLEKLRDMRKAFYEQDLQDVESYDVRKVIIEKHYAEEIAKAGGDKNIIEDLRLEKEKDLLTAARDDKKLQEEFAKTSAENSEKDVEDNKKKQEEVYKEDKSWSIKRLQTEIFRLNENKKYYNYTAKELQAIDEQTTTLRDMLNKKVADDDKHNMGEIIKDVRLMNDEKLKLYLEDMNNRLLVAQQTKNKPDIELYTGEIKSGQAEQITRKLNELKDIGNIFGQISNFAGQFDSSLGDAFNTMGKILSSANNIKNALNWTDKLSDGIAILDAYVSIMKSLFTSTGPTSQEKTILALQKFSDSIDKNTEALRRSIGLETLDNIVKVYTSWQTKRDADLQVIRDIKTWTTTGQYTGKTLGDIFTDNQLRNLSLGNDVLKADRDLYTKLITDINSAEAKMYDYTKEYQELITGTTEDAITDSIASGFEQGLDSAEYFADTFKDMMSTALIDSFKRTIETKAIDTWYTQFATLSGSDLTLTKEEIATLSASFAAFFGKDGVISKSWEDIENIANTAGVDLTGKDKQGLTGAMQGMSQETAGLLAGQFSAIRINLVNMLEHTEHLPAMDYGINNLNVQLQNIVILETKIADNTKYLISIDNKLSSGMGNGVNPYRAMGA